MSKKIIKKEVKKEVWGNKMDKSIANFKKEAIKNKNVTVFICTTEKNGTHAMMVNHYHDLSKSVASFLSCISKECPDAITAGMIKFLGM